MHGESRREPVPLEKDALAGLVARELSAPVSAATKRLTRAIRRRHGDAVCAVLFYGSCLRRGSDEGVHDFYVVVDDYRSAYPGSRWLRWLNRAVPPNVLWLEHGAGDEILRCKYAVLSRADLARLCRPGGVDGRVWARFAQPVGVVWARDEATRHAIERDVAEAVVSLVGWMLPWMPRDAGRHRFDAETLWRFAFRQTYRAEWRSERPETIQAIYDAAPRRYAAALSGALARLQLAGRIADLEEGEAGFACTLPGHAGTLGRLRWRLRQPLQKALLVLALLKTAFTQDDWVSYVLWKLERHSGVHIEVTEAQRRHPLLFGWPVILRILRQGILR